MTASYTGADLFVDILEEYGVTHVFGNPGTTELPVMNAIGESNLRYVLGLHEDIAVGMAAGYASTRRYHYHRENKNIHEVNPVGVVNLHVTPGLAHGTGNIYDALIGGAPLLVTAGDFSADFKYEEPILSGDLLELVDQFTKWSAEVGHVDNIPTMVRRAFKTALSPPTGPVFLSLPMDVMMTETEDEPERLGSIPQLGSGDQREIERAVEAVVEADNPVFIFGDGVARSDAVDEAMEFAEASGARVHAEILACEVNFPTTHPQWISFVPPDEGVASMLMSTDTIVFVGCSTNTTLHAHDSALVSEDTTCVHVGDDAWQLGKNQVADVAVYGDPGSAMQELTMGVRNRLDSEVREERLESVRQTKESVEATMESMGVDEAPGDPRASKAELVDAMQEVMPDAYIVDEGVTSKYALLTRFDLEATQYVSNKGGGLGYGLPAAVGAAIAEEQTNEPRDVVGFVADGSYLYYPHSIYSAVREGVDLTVVVPDNRNYRILKDNTLEIFGGSEEDYAFPGMDIDPPVDIPKSAESYGASSELVETPTEIEDALNRAMESSDVYVLDVMIHD